MLVLVVGASGVGKDTLMEAARRALAEDPRFRFVRRTITRPAEAGGEDHDPVSDPEFDERDHDLQWRAHGLRYGIPAGISEDLARGRIIVANVSRAVIKEAAERFPVRVIEVTAPPALLAARLAARGREDSEGVAARLSRSVALPAGVDVRSVVNDGSLAQGIERFLAALTES